MKALVERHLKAEGAGDIEGAVSVYTDDVEHDPVGFPGAPVPRQGRRVGRSTATSSRTSAPRTSSPTHEYATENALVMEQLMTGTVIGEMLGLPGNNRRITFRILHVFEFRDGLISRENVWLDTAAIVGQLAS